MSSARPPQQNEPANAASLRTRCGLHQGRRAASGSVGTGEVSAGIEWANPVVAGSYRQRPRTRHRATPCRRARAQRGSPEGAHRAAAGGRWQETPLGLLDNATWRRSSMQHLELQAPAADDERPSGKKSIRRRRSTGVQVEVNALRNCRETAAQADRRQPIQTWRIGNEGTP